MGEKCEDCQSWEEGIFWTHFQSTHFTLFLRGSFHQQLELPEKFAKHFKQKLPPKVTLKGPSGNSWEVGLSKVDETLSFNHGWQDFIRDHSLAENDILVFKFNGISVFEVLIFDGQSLCEKAASYFVRKCGHSENNHGSSGKRKLEENSAEVFQLSTDRGQEGIPEKSPNDDIKPHPGKRPIKPTIKIRMNNGVSSIRPIRAKYNLGTREPHTPVQEAEVKHKKRSIMKPAAPKRLVPEPEKMKALELARAGLREGGFLVVMKPSHVRTKFFMTIPAAWLTSHFCSGKQVMILRHNMTTWRARFNYYRQGDFGGLCGGWKSFATDNKLAEHDVCVFHPEDVSVRPLVFNVSIFRVLEEADHPPGYGGLVLDSQPNEVAASEG